MADNVYGNIECIETLLPFKENDKLAMRNVSISMYIQSDSAGNASFNTVRETLRTAKEERSLETALGVTPVTFEVLAKSIYDLLGNAQCVCVRSSGKSAYYGDPSAIFGGGGGASGGSSPEQIAAVRQTLTDYASATEPETQHALWESVKGLASDVADDLGDSQSSTATDDKET